MEFANIIEAGLRSAIGPTAAAYALLAIGLNLHYGYTGLFNFGQVGFMLLGAYGLGITVTQADFPLWLGALSGLALCGVFAVILGAPTLRLRTDYFAIVTIAAAEILRLAARSQTAEPLTEGVFGISFDADEFFDLNPIPEGDYLFNLSERTVFTMLVTWSLAILCSLLIAVLMRSPWGRVIKAIREDEDAVRSLGKNVFGYKMQSLAIGGMIGGLAGVMFAISASTVNPDAFAPQVTFFAYTILILGGAATRFGPIVGALIFWFLNSSIEAFLRQAGAEDLLPDFLSSSTGVGATSIALVGLGLMLLMIFRPQGIFGNREEMRLDA